jgi:very-short-patch-repair endonuclease
MSKPLTQTEYIDKANIEHNFFYSYGNFIYVDSHTKGIVICPYHGEFNIRASNHLQGIGCPACSNHVPYTLDTFIIKSNNIHNNKYKYDLVKWENIKSHIDIICPSHNSVFSQMAGNHLRGQGCPLCSVEHVGNIRRMTIEEFITRSNIIHNFFYSYHKFKYTDSKSSGIVICPIHGEFNIRASNHLQGIGCSKCAGNCHSNVVDFIKRAEHIHGDLYGYEFVKYTNAITHVIITCRTCNIQFPQTPMQHLLGHGCGICAGNVPYTTHKWIEIAHSTYGELFNYSLVNYINAHTQVQIICNTCNKTFSKIPYEHINDGRCPYCELSSGEHKVRVYLDINMLEYQRQKTFNGLVGIGNRLLRYDFFVPSQNLLIEYDGEQHYGEGYFGGTKTTEDQLLKTKEHDRRKDEYAKNNNIKLLRIPYWDMKKISEILSNNLTIP